MAEFWDFITFDDIDVIYYFCVQLSAIYFVLFLLLEMAKYLKNNLERIQAEYKELLRSTLASAGPDGSTPKQDQEQQGPEVSSYLERMRSKTRQEEARTRSNMRSNGSVDNVIM